MVCVCVCVCACVRACLRACVKAVNMNLYLNMSRFKLANVYLEIYEPVQVGMCVQQRLKSVCTCT